MSNTRIIRIWSFDFEEPTRVENYRPLMGFGGNIAPLRWQDDMTGNLPAAVTAYFDAVINDEHLPDEQLHLVIKFCQHYIHAPMWLEEPPFGVVDDEMAEAIKQVREVSLNLKSVSDVRAFVRDCMAIALDPF